MRFSKCRVPRLQRDMGKWRHYSIERNREAIFSGTENHISYRFSRLSQKDNDYIRTKNTSLRCIGRDYDIKKAKGVK